MPVSEALVDVSLLEAYRQTEYKAVDDPVMTLRISVPCQDLLKRYEDWQTDCCAFVTACNPRSEWQDEATNARLQADLAAELTRRGLRYLAGIGQHPTNGWLGEASWLVVGVSLEEAKHMGTQWAQNAVVWCGAEAVPQLMVLR